MHFNEVRINKPNFQWKWRWYSSCSTYLRLDSPHQLSSSSKHTHTICHSIEFSIPQNTSEIHLKTFDTYVAIWLNDIIKLSDSANTEICKNKRALCYFAGRMEGKREEVDRCDRQNYVEGKKKPYYHTDLWPFIRHITTPRGLFVILISILDTYIHMACPRS